MDPQVVIEWAFKGIMSGAFMVGIKILWAMKISIDELNHSMIVIVEKTKWHEKTLDEHKEKIERLEEKVATKG